MSVRARGFLLAALLVVVPGAALAAQGATKDEAVAMVKKAVAAIKTEGADKAYAEISDPRGPFVDGDLYRPRPHRASGRATSS
jgi:cytochrome c